MTATKTPNTVEMAELYRTTKMTQEEIGRIYGIGKKAVNNRLTGAGIVRRAPKYQSIKKAELYRLFHLTRWSIKKIAGNFQTDVKAIKAALEFHQIPLKRERIKIGGRQADFLRTLKIGEMKEIALNNKNPQAGLHRSATALGIRISMRAAGNGKFAVIRIN